MIPAYEDLPAGAPYSWAPATRGDRPWDQLDFHLDLGCGRLPKGRFGIDRRLPAPRDFHGLEMDLGSPGLVIPAKTGSIKSIVTHHFCEHLGEGFTRFMEECYRILEWGGVMRAIVPLFPSTAAVADPDHKRYFMERTWLSFTGNPAEGTKPTDAFAEPYNNCFFMLVDNDMSPPTPPGQEWTPDEAREQRVTLWKWRGNETGPPDPDLYR